MSRIRDAAGAIRRKTGSKQDAIDAVRYRRLVDLLQGAEQFEGTHFARANPFYFGLAQVAREFPDLLFGGTSNRRVRAEALNDALASAQQHRKVAS